MSWASAYSTSTFEEKKMIITQIVEKIHLKRDYETSVELKINYSDFCTDISADILADGSGLASGDLVSQAV